MNQYCNCLKGFPQSLGFTIHRIHVQPEQPIGNFKFHLWRASYFIFCILSFSHALWIIPHGTYENGDIEETASIPPGNRIYWLYSILNSQAQASLWVIGREVKCIPILQFRMTTKYYRCMLGNCSQELFNRFKMINPPNVVVS